MENLKNLEKIAKIFQPQNIITSEEIDQVLKGIMEILASYKKGTDAINEETKTVVNSLLEQTIKYNQETISDFKSEADKAHAERMRELQSFLSEVKTTLGDMEVMMGEIKNGEDADEERVIKEVINRIKIDPTVVTMSPEEIRDKLASLKDEERLDKSAIKGLEKVLQQKDLDYAIATLQHQASFLINKGGLKVVSHDSTLTGDGTPENPLAVAGGGSGITLQTNGTPNGDQTLLNLVAGTNVTLTDNGTGSITIAASGTGGSGDVTGPVSSTDNAIARFDGTTGKIIQNSTGTLDDSGILSVASGIISGTNGAGHINLRHQASDATATGQSTAIFADSNGDFKYKNDGNYYTTLKTSTNTADRTYTYPDATGTLALKNGLTTNQIAYASDSNTVSSLDTATYPSLTELSYVKGVTSAVQTQLNGKQATLTNPVTGTGTNNEIAAFNSTGSTITSLTTATYPSLTELSYVKGVTSAIQTQLNAKGTGTVTSVSSANGALTVATGTTTPVLTVNSAPILTTARTIGIITGDATSSGSSFDGSANNTNALTLATVNSNVGTFGSATQASQVTVNAKGLVTAASNVTVTPAVGSITGLGTGVATALAVNTGSAGAVVLFNGALGTPTSGTVTNLTGTASININGTVGATTPTTGSFTTVTTSGNIELGNASDTTLSRSSAGVLAVEGVVIPSISSTNTLTNKFITPQLQSVADAGGTLTPVSITNDMVIATALSQATTIAAPTGSPVQGERLVIRLKDNGTARALTWNAIYRAIGVTLPTTTVINKTVYCGFMYNSTDTKWDCVAVAQEA